MSEQNLKNIINYLFNRYWDEELTENEEDKIDEVAKSVISEYGWSRVYKALTDYLYQNCHTPEEAINAACNFWNCRWSNQIIQTLIPSSAFSTTKLLWTKQHMINREF